MFSRGADRTIVSKRGDIAWSIRASGVSDQSHIPVSMILTKTIRIEYDSRHRKLKYASSEFAEYLADGSGLD